METEAAQVQVGQVYASLDKRELGRTVKVVHIIGPRARVRNEETGMLTWVSLKALAGSRWRKGGAQ